MSRCWAWAGVLALGDPAYPRNSRLPRLHASADEVRAVGTTTLLGPEVDVTVETVRVWWWRYQVVKVNDAVFYATDIETDNGIVHLIGDVLIPPGDLEDES